MDESNEPQSPLISPPPLHVEENRWGIGWAIFAYLGFWVIQVVITFFVVIAYGMYRLADGKSWPMGENDFPPEIWGLTGIVAQITILLFVFFLIEFVHRLDWRKELNWPGKKRIGYIVAAGIGFMVMLFNMTMLYLDPPSEDMKVPLMDMTATIEGLVLFGFMAVFIAPFAEEFLFRGYIFKPFERSWGSKWAVVTTTVLFMLPHVYQLGEYWQGVILIGVLGAVTGSLRAYTGGLKASIICHLVYNTLLITIEALNRFIAV